MDIKKNSWLKRVIAYYEICNSSWSLIEKIHLQRNSITESNFESQEVGIDQKKITENQKHCAVLGAREKLFDTLVFHVGWTLLLYRFLTTWVSVLCQRLWSCASYCCWRPFSSVAGRKPVWGLCLWSSASLLLVLGMCFRTVHDLHLESLSRKHGLP